MNEAVLQKVLAAYDVQYQSIQPPQKGYRNSSYPVVLPRDKTLNLILYKSEPGILARIQQANTVANFLAAQGLPVRQSADKRIIKLQAGTFTKYAALYNYLPGDTIPWEAYTKDHLKLTGMAMAVLHRHMRQLPLKGTPVVDEYQAINERMRFYFHSESVQQALHKKLLLSVKASALLKNEKILKLCQKLPQQQMLHMDFVRSNLLFRPAQPSDRFIENSLALSGIIDFEKAAYGSPLFDIARTLAFLFVDCKYKMPVEIMKYFIRSGYIKRGQALFKDITVVNDQHRTSILESLVDLFLLYDFYKFLRHNPYEFLGQNEHFIRTRDMLLERKVLQYG